LNAALVRTLAVSESHAIQVVDPRGRLLDSSGRFVESAAKPFALDRSGQTSLIWNGTFFLRTSTQLVGRSQRPLGTLAIERELRAFSAEWKDLKRFDKTSESALCVLSSATTARCFPQARNPVFYSLPISVNGKTLPIGLALQGRIGTAAAVDYRGKDVIASFAPLAGTRLGPVIKQDASELFFAPIRQRLLLVLPMLGALVGVGLWLVRSQVLPLAVNLSRSERAAHEAHDLLALTEAGVRAAHDEIAAIVGGITDGLLTTDESSKIVSANAAATTMFGYGEDELVGMDLKVLMPPEFRAAHEAGMRRFLQDGTTRVIGRSAVELTGMRRNDVRCRQTRTRLSDGRGRAGHLDSQAKRKRNQARAGTTSRYLALDRRRRDHDGYSRRDHLHESCRGTAHRME